ncbi:MAG: hypothetical protein H7Z72_00315 [Bacteroidetes bacterium]|nr:hypothetical protein [Fibrella sp.]
MAHAQPQTMLQSTLQTLSRRDTTPATGADLLKDWISVLKNDAESVADKLSDLYDELLNREPNPERVATLLNTVAGQTQSIAGNYDAEKAESINQLADALRSLAIDLNPVGDGTLADAKSGNATVYANSGDRAKQLLDDTLTLFGNGPEITSAEQGVLFVEDWISVVKADVSTQWLEAPMTQLLNALNDGDLRETERLMRELAGTTQDLANNTAGEAYRMPLTNLATALISFAQPLS